MKELSRDTVALLENIVDRIDPDTEEQFEGQWRDFLFDRFDGELFCPTRIGRSASRAVYVIGSAYNEKSPLRMGDVLIGEIAIT